MWLSTASRTSFSVPRPQRVMGLLERLKVAPNRSLAPATSAGCSAVRTSAEATGRVRKVKFVGAPRWSRPRPMGRCR